MAKFEWHVLPGPSQRCYQEKGRGVQISRELISTFLFQCSQKCAERKTSLKSILLLVALVEVVELLNIQYTTYCFSFFSTVLLFDITYLPMCLIINY